MRIIRFTEVRSGLDVRCELLDAAAHCSIRQSATRCHVVVDHVLDLCRPRDSDSDRRMRDDVLEQQLWPRRRIELLCEIRERTACEARNESASAAIEK